MDNQKFTVEIGGSAKVYLDGEFIGEYHNVITNSCKDKILRTLIQDGTDAQIDATHYMKYMAFSTGAILVNPQSSNIASVQATVEVLTASAVVSGASYASSLISGKWTNATAGPLTINYIALLYGAGDTTTDKVYSVINLTPTIVEAGQTMIVNYTFYMMYA